MQYHITATLHTHTHTHTRTHTHTHARTHTHTTKKLCSYLGLPDIVVIDNGSILAGKALE